jgi:hypothetical protein
LFDDDEGENGDIGSDDASAHGLALTLARAASAITRVGIVKEKTDAVGEENALFHWEALLVVSAGDTEDVSLPFVAERIGLNFLRNAFVKKNAARE